MLEYHMLVSRLKEGKIQGCEVQVQDDYREDITCLKLATHLEIMA